MSVRHAATLSVALAGCGSLLAASGDDAPVSNPNVDGSDASTDAPVTADGGSTGAGCDARCVVLRDDFERPSANVAGPWTKVVGSPALATSTLSKGQELVARTAAGTGAAPREAFLEKTFAAARGVELALDLEVSPTAGYGPDYLDYCETASLLLGSKRIVLVYRDGSNDYLWVYGPNEEGGQGNQAKGRWLGGRIGLRVTWTSTDVTATVSRDGNEVATVSNTLDPAAVDAEAAIRVGLRCFGTTPDAVVYADDVEIVTPP